MNRFLKSVLFLCLIGMASGCATFKVIKEEKDAWQKSIFSANLPIGWVKYPSYGRVLLLTKDGVFLQNIMVSKWKIKKELPLTKKKIQKNMLIHEMATLVLDETMFDGSITDFIVLNKKPEEINGQQCFKLEYTFKNKEALKYHVLSYGFLHEDKFYQIEFRATEQHHFENSLPDFEKFLESFHVKDQEEKETI